jgi:hypothetical protein
VVTPVSLPAGHPAHVSAPVVVCPGQFKQPSGRPRELSGKYFPEAQSTQSGLVSPALLDLPAWQFKQLS